jgi:zinc protease
VICKRAACLIVVMAVIALGVSGAPRADLGALYRAAPGQTVDGGLPTVKRDTLLNGLQLISLPQEGSGTVKMHLRLNSGSMFDLAGKGGLADITVRMLLRGAGAYSAKNLADTASQLGLTISTKVTWDSTDLLIAGPASSFDSMMDLLGQLVVNPTFNQAELDQLKSQRLTEIIAEPRTDLQGVSRRALETLFGTFPYGRPEDGTTYTIARILRDDVVYYHDRFYLANNAELVVSGDVNVEEVTRIARAKLGFWKKGEIVPATFRPSSPPVARQLLVLDSVDSGTAQAAVAQIAISRRASDYFPTLIAAELLRTLPEKGSETIVEAELDARTLAGPLLVTVKSSPNKIVEAVDRIIDAMGRLRQGQIIPAQLQQAKDHLISLYLRKAANPDGLVDALLDLELYRLGRDYIINYSDRVQAVTASEVAQAALAHMDPQALVVVVSGPAAKIEPDIRKLGNVSVLKDQQISQ